MEVFVDYLAICGEELGVDVLGIQNSIIEEDFTADKVNKLGNLQIAIQPQIPIFLRKRDHIQLLLSHKLIDRKAAMFTEHMNQLYRVTGRLIRVINFNGVYALDQHSYQFLR